MPLFERIKDAVGVGQGPITYRYHCRQCGTEFESEEQSRTSVACPNCGATGSRAISRM